jgi:hypothetical protein
VDWVGSYKDRAPQAAARAPSTRDQRLKRGQSRLSCKIFRFPDTRFKVDSDPGFHFFFSNGTTSPPPNRGN